MNFAVTRHRQPRHMLCPLLSRDRKGAPMARRRARKIDGNGCQLIRVYPRPPVVISSVPHNSFHKFGCGKTRLHADHGTVHGDRP
jgi:hypothetical protein